MIPLRRKRWALVLPNHGTSFLLTSPGPSFGAMRHHLLSAACALFAAHCEGLCYGDLKPEHIVVSVGLSVIIDGGSMKPFGEAMTSCTPRYCLDTPLVSSPQLDFICLATTAYHMHHGKHSRAETVSQLRETCVGTGKRGRDELNNFIQLCTFQHATIFDIIQFLLPGPAPTTTSSTSSTSTSEASLSSSSSSLIYTSTLDSGWRDVGVPDYQQLHRIYLHRRLAALFTEYTLMDFQTANIIAYYLL